MKHFSDCTLAVGVLVLPCHDRNTTIVIVANALRHASIAAVGTI